MPGYPRVDIPNPLKRILPQSLFGRALLILVIPTILIQLVATYIFYERHWENISRWMASSLAGEIALLVHEVNGSDAQKQQQLAIFAEKLMSIHVQLEPEANSQKFLRSGEDISPIFFTELKIRLNLPFSLKLEDDDQTLLVRVKLENDILALRVTRKRLVSSTTYIFITWMVGSALLLTGIAVIFLRNQIRPITKLATVMDKYGRGHDTPGFRPQGAAEVRRAGRAYQQMRQRLDRQISARMEMLAGISHDLRTPLTRMKLQLEMLGEKEAARDLRRDVSDMEHMIEEYLDFVRGEGQEAPQTMPISDCLEDIIARYKSHNQTIPVEYNGHEHIDVDIRPHVFRRALMNVIDNALRYGTQAHISVFKKRHHVEICVDDNGPGIPREKREAVFKPFTRLDSSRNVGTGGVGLGLTITRDIIHGHGGDVFLQESAQQGLRVIIRLPL
ncbi:MAG: ATP-binding protein [Alphaproteobacteria bacterium]|nr:ATP-binding protein [Alphaproteobacteria bacterium]